MLEGIVTSDWHLDRYHISRDLNQYFPERQDIDIQMNEIGKAFDYAISNGIPNVFIGGDIGETYELTPAAEVALLTLLLRFDGTLNIYIILGNHDVADIETNSLSIIRLLEKNNKFQTVYLFKEPELVNVDGVPVNMLPFPHTDPLQDNAINFAHVSAKNAKNDNGRRITDGYDVDFSKGNNFWISGHLHSYQKSSRGFYCGSPYQRSFGENLPCGFVHFRSGFKQSKLRVQHKFINSRVGITLNNIHIASRNDWKNIRKDRYAFYKVTVGDVTVPNDIRERYPNIVSIKGDTVQIREFKETQEIPEIDMVAGLRTFLAKEGLTDEAVERGVQISEAVKEKYVTA